MSTKNGAEVTGRLSRRVLMPQKKRARQMFPRFYEMANYVTLSDYEEIDENGIFELRHGKKGLQKCFRSLPRMYVPIYQRPYIP